MDIRQAKIILIVFFLIINIVLFGINVFTGNDNRVSAQILENVRELFEKNDIILNCEIPDNLASVPQLNMGDEIRIGRVAGNEMEQSNFSFDIKDYVFVHDFGDYEVYAEKYSNSIVLENRISVYSNSMEYMNREINGFDTAKKNIMPAYAILLKEYLNSDVVSIDKIQMIYLKYVDDDIIGPIWFIEADGEVRLFYAFEAFNGIEIPGGSIIASLGGS